MVDVPSTTWDPANPVWAPGHENDPVVIGTLRTPGLGIHGWGGFTIAVDKARYLASSGLAGPPPAAVEPPPVTTTPPPPPPAAGTLRATVTLNGTDYIYDEAQGQDLGSYSDPAGRFSESCRRVTRSDCRIRCDFRRMAGRISVVFGQGLYTDQDPVNLDPYTATISGDGMTPVELQIPVHPAYSRWRWCSAQWPLPIRPIAELVAARLMPAFNPALTRGTDVNPGPHSYTPLSLAGLTAYMPQTGERDDIGLVTNVQGWYICHEGTPLALDSVLAQGEAGGTFTWDFLDPATGAVIDPIIGHPGASVYDNVTAPNRIWFSPVNAFGNIVVTGPPGSVVQSNDPVYVTDDNPGSLYRINATIPASGSITVWCGAAQGMATPKGTPKLANAPPGVTLAWVPGTTFAGSGITLDTAHMPALSYLPFLLTGDPYYLENLQRQAAFIVMENPSAPVRTGWVSQPRATGWSARTLAQVAKATPATVPSWLLPQSTFLTAIDQWLTLTLPNTCDSTAPERTILHLVSNADVQYQPYQEDLCLGGFAWMALLHPTTRWMDVLKWHAKQSMARLDPTSGWATAIVTGYLWNVRPASGQPYYGSWAAMWAGNAAMLGIVDGTTPQGLTEPPGGFGGALDYLNTMAGGMALAWQAGVTENAPFLTRLETPLLAALAKHRPQETRQCKWAIAGPVT